MTTRRPFWLALTAFFLLGAAWATALPVNGTYDESHHIARAYAVFSAQWLPEDRRPTRVPASLLPVNPDCTWFPRPPKPASCQQPADGGGLVDAPSYAARYPPMYYLIVGLPIRLVPNGTGLLVARLISALANALLLATAVWVAAALGKRLLIAAVALAATPTVLNLAGAINSNGLEISSAVLLFVALLALAPPHGSATADPVPRRQLLTMAGVAALLLLTVRHLGPVLLAIDLLAVGAIAGPEQVRRQLRRRDTRTRLVPFLATGVVATVGWLVIARSPVAGVPTGPLPDRSAGEFVDGLVTFRMPFYIKQVIGQFGYGETTISPLAIALWYGLLAVVVVPAVVQGSRRSRAVMVGLVAVSLTLLVALELAFIHAHRWYAHGRYALPVLVGVVLIAAWAQPRQGGGTLPMALVAATAPVHLYALARVMTRYQVGIESSLNPLGGSWHPTWGSALPLASVVLGAGLLTAVTWGGALDPGPRLPDDAPATSTPAIDGRTTRKGAPRPGP